MQDGTSDLGWQTPDAPVKRGGQRLQVEHTEITDLNLQARVRARYRLEIMSLQALGFRPLAFCLKTMGPVSAILQLPMLLLMLAKKEVLFAFCMGMASRSTQDLLTTRF